MKKVSCFRGVSLVLVCVFMMLVGQPAHLYAMDRAMTNGEKLESLIQTNNEPMAVADKNKIEKESKSNKVYKQIVDKVFDKGLKKTSKTYDSSYGGAYINENGELVVLVTESGKDFVKSLNLEGDNDVLVCKATYSYNNLVDLKEAIESQYKKQYVDVAKANTKTPLNEMLTSMREIYIDEVRNAVVVCMMNLSEEKMKAFKTSIINNAAIIFEESGELREEATTLYTGQEIQINNGGTYYLYSIGFRAWKSTSSGTIYGFVTAGHGNAVSDNVYDTSSNLIGYVESRQYSGSIDASFIKITKDYSVSNTIKYSDSSGTTSGANTITGSYYITSLATGSTVYKCGRTTYLTSGTVKSSSDSWTINGTTFTDLLKCDYNSDGGDSGGVVYTYFNNMYELAAIHKGSSSFLIWHSSYSVKATNIISGMSVMLY
ncbi:chymotrypsin family serine protease [Lachnoclostridium phytofermentans]|uniref:Uncharacterized protein n=1 Tax=Lachnoclostridium phytofermentans (strain ATCC 700394 / DSM 18823 / ISDg) TaxID=357809 RepID=A9KK02_LACP7|nr:hypothetical protein [Lachnoclostridium phytofermentans]ABX42574.1 hypothetical protein Cphy_2208 [Lachnoclostridium phytofermentans ISDg]